MTTACVQLVRLRSYSKGTLDPKLDLNGSQLWPSTARPAHKAGLVPNRGDWIGTSDRPAPGPGGGLSKLVWRICMAIGNTIWEHGLQEAILWVVVGPAQSL